jgi:hypothetical protein
MCAIFKDKCRAKIPNRSNNSSVRQHYRERDCVHGIALGWSREDLFHRLRDSVNAMSTIVNKNGVRRLVQVSFFPTGQYFPSQFWWPLVRVVDKWCAVQGQTIQGDVEDNVRTHRRHYHH